MVYFQYAEAPQPERSESGYAIHEVPATDEILRVFEIYTDDGRGNGNYVCTCSDEYWAKVIANALDKLLERN